jgi:hypothetical protein
MLRRPSQPVRTGNRRDRGSQALYATSGNRVVYSPHTHSTLMTAPSAVRVCREPKSSCGFPRCFRRGRRTAELPQAESRESGESQAQDCKT